MKEKLAFQGQLLSLAKVCGPIVPAMEPIFSEAVEVGVLVPVRVSEAHHRL